MTINVGDKIILKKEMGAFKSIGEECEIVSIEDNIISFKFGNGMHLGCMSEDELEKYFSVKKKYPTVTEETIAELIKNSLIETETIYEKCTLVTIKLPNGFIISESSACVSPENYDEMLGYDICMDKITEKLWELEGYALQKKIYEEQLNKDNKANDGNMAKEYDW